MKKRYFLASLLALGVMMNGCGTTTDNNYFKNYDLVMFVENPPKPKEGSYTISKQNVYEGIADCSSFVNFEELDNECKYGTAYYDNHQNHSVTLTVQGEDIEESITIPAQTSKGIVWQKSPLSNAPTSNYTITLISDDTEKLNGYFTLGASSCAFDLTETLSDCIRTITYSNYIKQKENLFHTPITLTDEQPSGRAYYTNTQDAIATLNVKGNGFNKTIEVPPFTARDIDWKKVSTGNQEYTITIRCEEGHTLNGFLNLNRFVVLEES